MKNEVDWMGKGDGGKEMNACSVADVRWRRECQQSECCDVEMEMERGVWPHLKHT